ncbi:hypothetical protein [Agrobacterium larrymoorei]|uniref:Uncharacterized protein n=1 Tax=Agrobacterium larrymoorei TaxID=160699 RepID=A0ABU0UEL7_9HYPH|nr:hypothetical protein [Agrobacterium larrymoorei]MDQ1183352.1 hypothetical protein [Agrobacterium larrymoorei]
MSDPPHAVGSNEVGSVSRLQQSESLNVYKLAPVAKADDPHWDKGASYGEVLVAARSSGDARIVATEAQPDASAATAQPFEDVSTRFASAFRDETLYTVIEVERDRPDVERGMIPKLSVDATMKAGGDA